MSKKYLNALTYAYTAAPDPFTLVPAGSAVHQQYMGAPAPMRVIVPAAHCSTCDFAAPARRTQFFSSHAQPMAALIETDFWSPHRSGGRPPVLAFVLCVQWPVRVYPCTCPFNQDAVLLESLPQNAESQFLQLRRWTYGASDVAYVPNTGSSIKQDSKWDLWTSFWRLLEGHVTWAVGPVLILIGGVLPALFNHKNNRGLRAAVVVSKVQTSASLGDNYRVHARARCRPTRRATSTTTLFMVLQWRLLPGHHLRLQRHRAFNSQTRLMFHMVLTKSTSEKAVIVRPRTTAP